MDLSSVVFDYQKEAELVRIKKETYAYIEEVKKEETKVKLMLDAAKETLSLLTAE